MERLGDVVVCAEIEPLRLVGGGALGGQQDHRDRTGFPQLTHHLDAVEVGHHDVQQDHVRPVLLGLRERFGAPDGRDDPEPLLAEGSGPSLVIRGSSSATRTRGCVDTHRLRSGRDKGAPGASCVTGGIA